MQIYANGHTQPKKKKKKKRNSRKDAKKHPGHFTTEFGNNLSWIEKLIIFVFNIKHLTDVTKVKDTKWGEDELTLSHL